MATGAPGANGVAASLGGSFNATDVVITKIGGPFADNATKAGSFNLAAGTYVINGNAFFDRINDAPVGSVAHANASSPLLQLALRVPDGSQWGLDVGTAFTAPFPATGNLEQTVSTSRVVTLAADATVDVYVFGYNEDTSSKGSGNYNADLFVNAVRVQS